MSFQYISVHDEVNHLNYMIASTDALLMLPFMVRLLLTRYMIMGLEA